MEGQFRLPNAKFSQQYFSPSEADIAAQVRSVFAKHIAVDVSRSHPDDKLVEELQVDALDSMSAIEFVLELDEHFNITIPDSAARQMRTLRDLTSFISCELKSNGCA
jgi:acyl carrier protein